MKTLKIHDTTGYSIMFQQVVHVSILEVTLKTGVEWHVLVQNTSGVRLGLPSIHKDINEAIEYGSRAF